MWFIKNGIIIAVLRIHNNFSAIKVALYKELVFDWSIKELIFVLWGCEDGWILWIIRRSASKFCVLGHQGKLRTQSRRGLVLGRPDLLVRCLFFTYPSTLRHRKIRKIKITVFHHCDLVQWNQFLFVTLSFLHFSKYLWFHP